MLRPRDLPIAAKLGLSACCALLLLGALTWTVRDSMARLSAIDQRNAAAEAAARELATVRTASLEMRVASREIEYQQSVAAVQSVVRGAEQQAKQARAVLQTVASGEETEGGRKLLSDATAALATYTAALQRAAELRSAVLDTRERTFFPSTSLS
jgi:hypothetical protein